MNGYKEIRTYKLGEFARLLGIHPKTLQRYDKENRVSAYRTETNRRYYYYWQYLKFITEQEQIVDNH